MRPVIDPFVYSDFCCKYISEMYQAFNFVLLMANEHIIDK